MFLPSIHFNFGLQKTIHAYVTMFLDVAIFTSKSSIVIMEGDFNCDLLRTAIEKDCVNFTLIHKIGYNQVRKKN